MQRSDELIKKDVVEQLFWNSRVDASNLKVSVEDGTVVLEGSAPSYLAWESALNSARLVPGVSEVRDQLSVKYPEPRYVPTDDELEEKVERTLAWNADIDSTDIDVEVEGGLVTLEGAVDAYWKKTHAEETASRLDGVLNIENELAVVPTDDVIDKEIARDVTSALERNVLINEERVNVRVEDGEVYLTGTVNTWAAERAAFQAALYTQGVTDVTSKLAVKA